MATLIDRMEIHKLTANAQRESRNGNPETAKELMTEFADLARELRDAAQCLGRYAISVGSTVAFTARNGRRITGTVTKLNRKTAGVHPAGAGRDWRVPFSMLEVTKLD